MQLWVPNDGRSKSFLPGIDQLGFLGLCAGNPVRRIVQNLSQYDKAS